jgi:hypothetical protein
MIGMGYFPDEVGLAPARAHSGASSPAGGEVGDGDAAQAL